MAWIFADTERNVTGGPSRFGGFFRTGRCHGAQGNAKAQGYCVVAAAIDRDRSSEVGLILAKTGRVGMRLLSRPGASARLDQFGTDRIGDSRGLV